MLEDGAPKTHLALEQHQLVAEKRTQELFLVTTQIRTPGNICSRLRIDSTSIVPMS